MDVSTRSSTYQQNLFNRYHCNRHFSATRWRRKQTYGTGSRRCRPKYQNCQWKSVHVLNGNPPTEHISVSTHGKLSLRCCYIRAWSLCFSFTADVVRIDVVGSAFVRRSRWRGTRHQVFEDNDHTRHVVTAGAVAIRVRCKAKVEHLRTNTRIWK